MKFIDTEIELNLQKQFTSIIKNLNELIKKYNLTNANLICWVPHEVSSLVQLGWENGLVDDMKKFLEDTIPENKWKKHDEPNTPFRYNFFQHNRTKLIGTVSMTFIVKNGELYIGKYQDVYFYTPVFKDISKQKIFCRILQF